MKRHFFPFSAWLVAFAAIGVFCIGVPVYAASSTEVIPNDTFWGKQWYLRQVHAPEAWSVTTGSHDVVVAVIDGGVDINHRDLKDNIWTNTAEIPGNGIDDDHDGFVDDVHGWNFVTGSPDVGPVYRKVQYEDVWSHGTLIASLLGAKGNDGIGIAGMDWNVRIMPLVVLDADGSGQVDDIKKAIRYAMSHGANIINLSVVGYDYDPELDTLIQQAAADNIVMVAATGNDDTEKIGLNIDEVPAYPVCMDGSDNVILGVSGTDTLDQKAPYANYGKICTDLAAPAQDLFAAKPSYAHEAGHSTTTVSGYLDQVTGTSLAAPLVSGVAALIKSVRPDWTAKQIRDRIRSTTDSIEDNLPADLKGMLGTGRLNAARALEGLTPLASLTTIQRSSTLATFTTSSWVTFYDPSTGLTKKWQPYGKLNGGIYSLALPQSQGWLLWPTSGGGQATVIDARGNQIQQFFPFGKERVGRWSLSAGMDAGFFVVQGPSRFRGVLYWTNGRLYPFL